MNTSVTPKSRCTQIGVPSRHRIFQNYLIIWADEHIGENNEEVRKAVVRLKSVINEVKLCTTSAQCVEILHSLTDENAFVIASGNLGKYLVRSIHSMICVQTIYIYCSNKAFHEQWAKEWVKIQGVFTSFTAIYESLKKEICESDQNAIPMSFAPKSSTEEVASNHEVLNQLSPTFMYSVLFKEIILDIQDDNDSNADKTKSMRNFIEYCHELKISQHDLDIFQREYLNKSAIWLYTCEMFLYRILNHGLRSLDMRAMTKMAFLIRKLHQELEELHQTQANLFKEKFTVYRGQSFKPQDFEQLVGTKDGLLSFNNFLSTSKSLEVAMRFAHVALAHKDSVVVLFIMTIDPSKISIASTPFAFVDERSAIPQEQEILFSMHTIFRVDDIRRSACNSRLWEVQLIITDQNDPQLSVLTHRIREEIHDKGWLRMGKLMIKVGHFDEAEELYDELLENCSDDYEQAAIYQDLGRVKRYQGEYQRAVEYYEKSLEMHVRTLPEDHPSLANTYNNIGLVSNNMGDYSKALKFYEKAHQIKKKNLSADHPKLATSYHNMGQVYNNMGDYTKALEFHRKANDINQNVLPKNHPHIATDYDNIGLVYNNMGDYSKALELYQEAHRIRRIALPPNHPNLATSYVHLATSYQRMGNFTAALEALESALQIQQQSLSENNPDYASTYNKIGETYRCLKDYAKALEYFERSLSIRQRTLPEQHPDLAIIYGNIGDTYSSMGNYEKALMYHAKALTIQENIHCSPLERATTYVYIAEVYEKMKAYLKASEYFEKALQIRKTKLPRNHPDLASLYHNIAKSYLATHDYAMAMENIQKALVIAEEKLSATHPSLLGYRETLETVKKYL